MNSSLKRFWPLEKGIDFLNHGSFGSCPSPVLDVQTRLRHQLERQPVRFFLQEMEARMDDARTCLARFLKGRPDNLVFVPNATAGVNTVLRSLRFRRGDELLVTDHAYNACRNALHFVACNSGARVRTVAVPFPVRKSAEVVEAIMSGVTSRTRLALLDHVTSPTALILPIAKLVRELENRGVDTLVDGAHAPGMLPLNLDRLGATYYTGNCHKWLCAPKGAGFLYVRPEYQSRVRPLSISHGANSNRRDRARWLLEFGWTGTMDPSAYLCVPEALRFMEGLLPGGWPGLMQRNRQLTLRARSILCRSLDIEAPCPESMVGSMASLLLSPKQMPEKSRVELGMDPLHEILSREFRIEVPVFSWPAPSHRVLRMSAQAYNSLEQYQRLAKALRQVLAD